LIGLNTGPKERGGGEKEYGEKKYKRVKRGRDVAGGKLR